MTSSRSRIVRRLAAPVLLAALALGVTTTPAHAQTSYGRWSFQADVNCSPENGHAVSMRVWGGNADGVPAQTAYRVWLNWNGAWHPVTDWKYMGERYQFLDWPPEVSYNTAGRYQFWMQYAIWTSNGWAYPPGEHGVYTIWRGGFSETTSQQFCDA
jgi:hypothetical protein